MLLAEWPIGLEGALLGVVGLWNNNNNLQCSLFFLSSDIKIQVEQRIRAAWLPSQVSPNGFGSTALGRKRLSSPNKATSSVTAGGARRVLEALFISSVSDRSSSAAGPPSPDHHLAPDALCSRATEEPNGDAAHSSFT